MTATQLKTGDLASSLVAGQSLLLNHGEVHVWYADLDALLYANNPQEILAKNEYERACRFRFAQDQRRFMAGRQLLRVLLGAYLGCTPRKIPLDYSAFGKPSLGKPLAASSIKFNVSHSDRMALLAFVRGLELGVDIEQIREDFNVEEIAEHFFSAAERETLAKVPPQLRHVAFFNCWTRKEAFVKAKGNGLSLPLDQFDVSLAPGEPAQLLATRPDVRERERWSFFDFRVDSGYASAIAVEGKDIRVVMRPVSEAFEMMGPDALDRNNSKITANHE